MFVTFLELHRLNGRKALFTAYRCQCNALKVFDAIDPHSNGVTGVVGMGNDTHIRTVCLTGNGLEHIILSILTCT